MRNFTALFVLAALAACGEVAPDAPSPAAETGTASPSTPSPGASPSTSGSATRISQFPASLQGTWGLTPNDCDRSRGDAKGILTITAEEARFYESRARMIDVASGADGGIAGTFAFTGEGMEWQRTMRLTPAEGGTVLIREDLVTEPGAPPVEGPLRYTRCPLKESVR